VCRALVRDSQSDGGMRARPASAASSERTVDLMRWLGDEAGATPADRVDELRRQWRPQRDLPASAGGSAAVAAVIWYDPG